MASYQDIAPQGKIASIDRARENSSEKKEEQIFAVPQIWIVPRIPIKQDAQSFLNSSFEVERFQFLHLHHGRIVVNLVVYFLPTHPL
jgi:hypothetical protein